MARVLALLGAATACCVAAHVKSAASSHSPLYQGDCQVFTGSSARAFTCETAAFGDYLPQQPVQLQLRFAGDDGGSQHDSFACDVATPAKYDGVVVIVRRGGCGFQQKLANVVASGARGMILVNTDDSPLLLGALEYEPLGNAIAVAVSRTEGDELIATLLAIEPVRVTLGASLSVLDQAWRRIQHHLTSNAPMLAYEAFQDVMFQHPIVGDLDILLALILRDSDAEIPDDWQIPSLDEAAQLAVFSRQCALAFGDNLEFTGDVSFHAAVAAAALVTVYPHDHTDKDTQAVLQLATSRLIGAGYYNHAARLGSLFPSATSPCMSAFIQFLNGDVADAVRASRVCTSNGDGDAASVNASAAAGLDVGYQNFQRLAAFKLSASDEMCLDLTMATSPQEKFPADLSRRKASCCKRRSHRRDSEPTLSSSRSDGIHRRMFWYKSAFIEELFHSLNIMGVFLDEIGAFQQSKLFFRRASRLCEDRSLSLEFRDALAVPIVFDSTPAMHSFLDQLHNNIHSLLTLHKQQQEHPDHVLSSSTGTRYYVAHPSEAAYLRYTITPPTMFIGYQGHDVLPLQRAIFQLRASLFPALQSTYKPLNTLLAQPEKGPKKRRIAFVSTWFRNHSVGKLLLGIIQRLDRSKFHVLIYRAVHFLKHSDEWTKQFHTAADSYLELPVNQDDALALLRHEAIDVLVYPELGMDAWTLLLSHHRIAPVQCVFWGHPIPTGNPSIDYFISSEYFISDFFEQDNRAAHQESAEWPGMYHGTSFSEQVVLFRGLSTFFQNKSPLKTGAVAFDRARIHLPASARLYVCPQTLMKLHPDFDAVLRGILTRDPRARVVLLSSSSQRVWKEQLRRRFRRSLGKDHRRVLFFSTLPYREFMGLLSTADVVLDPFPFGGGVTTLDALAVGTPVVTLPSVQNVPQLAAGFMRYMELTETIVSSVDAYVTTALRIAQDKAYRQELHDRILAQHHTIYEDASAVDDWNTFLAEVAIDTGTQA